MTRQVVRERTIVAVQGLRAQKIIRFSAEFLSADLPLIKIKEYPLKRRWPRVATGIVCGLVLALSACWQAEKQSGSGQSTKVATAQLPRNHVCCNLRGENAWINAGNYAELPFIPAGISARVTGYGRCRASVDLGGKPMRGLWASAGSPGEWRATIEGETGPKLSFRPVTR